MYVRQNLRGGISSQRPEMYILTDERAPFSGTGISVWQNLRGGI